MNPPTSNRLEVAPIRTLLKEARERNCPILAAHMAACLTALMTNGASRAEAESEREKLALNGGFNNAFFAITTHPQGARRGEVFDVFVISAQDKEKAGEVLMDVGVHFGDDLHLVQRQISTRAISIDGHLIFLSTEVTKEEEEEFCIDAYERYIANS